MQVNPTDQDKYSKLQVLGTPIATVYTLLLNEDFSRVTPCPTTVCSESTAVFWLEILQWRFLKEFGFCFNRALAHLQLQTAEQDPEVLPPEIKGYLTEAKTSTGSPGSISQRFAISITTTAGSNKGSLALFLLQV